jgi:hypothetical protein
MKKVFDETFSELVKDIFQLQPESVSDSKGPNDFRKVLAKLWKFLEARFNAQKAKG